MQLDQLKAFFPATSERRILEAQEILRPWEKLLPITIEGNRVFLPEGNSLWRGMQFWGMLTGEISIDFSLFCIAGTCKNCKSRMRLPGNPERVSALACQTQVQEGLEIVKLPQGFRFRKDPARPWDATTPAV